MVIREYKREDYSQLNKKKIRMYKIGLSLSAGLFLALALNICSPQPALAVSCGNNRSHNAYFGQRKPGDQLLFMDHPKMEFKFLRVVTYDINFPSATDPKGEITYIEIEDQYTDKTGGCAQLQSGGVGSNFVKLHLKSQRNYGLDFKVRIFGKRY